MLDRIADGRTDLVFDYVGAGNPSSATVAGASLIRWCHYYGDVSAIKFLLAHGESLAALGENFGLNRACFHGHWRLCQYLIEQGADVNWAAPDSGETALHASLAKANRVKYTPVLRILLSAGGRSESRDNSWRRDWQLHVGLPDERGSSVASRGRIRKRRRYSAAIGRRRAH
jgi:uncharacterized protein